jgi:hypothetical protein
MSSPRPALRALLCAAVVSLVGASAASADVTQTENLTLKTTDSPRLRFEQTGGAFGSQTWDLSGNESNFFVRDVTGGNRLPFRIRPGAPTSSLDIAPSGNIGFGSANPQAALEIAREGQVGILYSNTTPGSGVSWGTGIAAGSEAFTIGRQGVEPGFELQSTGDLDLAGSLGEAANQATVAELQNVDPTAILAKVASLPIESWRFSGAPVGDRHLGPLAGSFSTAFDLGESGNLISTSDVAGVSLAAVQALAIQNEELSTQSEELETQSTVLTAQNKAFATQLATVESTNAGLSSRSQELVTQGAALAAQSKAVASGLATAESTNTALAARVNKLELATPASQDDGLAARVANLERLQPRVSKLAKNVRRLRAAVKQLRK